VDADAVQENCPEQLDFKQRIFARIEQATRLDTLLLSSTSGIRATQIAEAMKQPGRLVVGHPFNPPHLIPLVEDLGSPPAWTNPPSNCSASRPAVTNRSLFWQPNESGTDQADASPGGDAAGRPKAGLALSTRCGPWVTAPVSGAVATLDPLRCCDERSSAVVEEAGSPAAAQA
jgi:hypothetical protein